MRRLVAVGLVAWCLTACDEQGDAARPNQPASDAGKNKSRNRAQPAPVDANGGEIGVDEPVCVIERAEPPGSSYHDYIRVSYDAAARVLTREWSRDAEFAEIHLKQRSLLDGAGRALVTTGQDFFNKMAYRFDRELDDQGNVLVSLATYTDDLVFEHVPGGPHYSVQRFEHAYDAQGNLSESTSLESEPGYNYTKWTYHSEPDGRCQSIAAEGERRGTSNETFAYDGDRLSGSHEVLTIDGTKIEIESTLHYDDQGRARAFEQDGDEHNHNSADGVPDIIRSYDYAADGVVTIVSTDYTSDQPNLAMERDGEEIWAYRMTRTLSSACNEISKQVVAPRATTCGFQVPLLTDLTDR